MTTAMGSVSVPTPLFHLVGTFAGNPQVALRACKSWNHSIRDDENYQWYAALFKAYVRDPFLELYVLRAHTYDRMSTSKGGLEPSKDLPFPACFAPRRVKQIYQLIWQDATSVTGASDYCQRWVKEFASDRLSPNALHLLLDPMQEMITEGLLTIFRPLTRGSHTVEDATKIRAFENSLIEDDLTKAKAIHKWINKEKGWFNAMAARPQDNATRRNHFNFSSCKLRIIPTESFLLTSLTSLNFHENLLTKVPDQISAVRHLRYLDLSGNLLEELPDALCELDSLISLSVHHNLVKALPKNFAWLTELQYLFLAHNNITALPENFDKLKQMESVACDPHLEKSVLQKLPQLKYLNGRNAKDGALLRDDSPKALPARAPAPDPIALPPPALAAPSVWQQIAGAFSACFSCLLEQLDRAFAWLGSLFA